MSQGLSMILLSRKLIVRQGTLSNMLDPAPFQACDVLHITGVRSKVVRCL